jgi:hypothetical protein
LNTVNDVTFIIFCWALLKQFHCQKNVTVCNRVRVKACLIIKLAAYSD